ncbi:hypothetical protein J6590_055069 [Homalodisca vitripennis]|nr:hypothetical protein J6590_055069 [Homalodisca vitripennis]
MSLTLRQYESSCRTPACHFRMTSMLTRSECIKKKPLGPAKTVSTPETVERVRLAAVQSPSRSIRKRHLLSDFAHPQ